MRRSDARRCYGRAVVGRTAALLDALHACRRPRRPAGKLWSTSSLSRGVAKPALLSLHLEVGMSTAVVYAEEYSPWIPIC
jgi:hypothetical protein